jgi:hypothetical protein
MVLPKGFHTDPVTGALERRHAADAPCPSCDRVPASSTVGGGTRSPTATTTPYIEVAPSTVDGATLGQVALGLVLLTDELGLSEQTRIRWFAPAEPGEDPAFEHAPGHKAHVAGREPEAIWLRSDLDADLALRILAHECCHAQQWASARRGGPLADDDAAEVQAQQFEQRWWEGWQRKDAHGPLVRRLKTLADGERLAVRRPGGSPLARAGAGSSPLAAALRARREGR